MSFEDVVATVRGLCGTQVASTLFDHEGTELARWEGELREEEGATARSVMFVIGAKPFLLDRGDLAKAEPVGRSGVRLHGTDGTWVELAPA